MTGAQKYLLTTRMHSSGDVIDNVTGLAIQDKIHFSKTLNSLAQRNEKCGNFRFFREALRVVVPLHTLLGSITLLTSLSPLQREADKLQPREDFMS